MFRFASVWMIIGLFVLPGAVFPAWGAVYYVAPSGNDSGSGDQKSPWKTLQHAANKVKGGDTVLVENGGYAGFFSVNDGTEKDPIVFKANGKNVVIHSRNAHTEDNINIEGTDYIVIDGFVVKDAPRGGIRVAESKGVIVKNNQVGPCQRWCIFTGFAPGVQILHNKTFEAIDQHGIYVSNSRVPNDNPIIRGNEIHDNGKSGIQINGDCGDGGDGIISGAIIENNIVYSNSSKPLSLISMQDSIVRNNLIYDNGLRTGAGGIHLTDEPGCGKPSNRNLIVNNTIVEPRIAGIRITDDAEENVIFNNVIFAPNKDRIADEVEKSFIDKDSNLLLRSMPKEFFVNPDGNNYRLLPGSPARDAGKAAYLKKEAASFDLEGTKRPQGKQVDIGAFEYK